MQNSRSLKEAFDYVRLHLGFGRLGAYEPLTDHSACFYFVCTKFNLIEFLL